MDLREILDVSDSYQIPEKLMQIIYNEKEREELFMKLLEVNNYEVRYDWFTKHFEDEHADRKVKREQIHAHKTAPKK